MKKYQFNIPSINVGKILDKFTTHNIPIYDLDVKEQTTFYCLPKDKKKIQKILESIGIIVKSQNYTRMYNNFLIFKSWGIILGIIISVCMFIVSNILITNVIIEGNVDISLKEIYAVLNEMNIGKYSLKSSIDTQELENKIEDIKYISYVSIIIKGNVLLINVKEQLTNNEVISLNTYSPLTAYRDCKITNITLVQGTLNKKVGDIVKSGEVLVFPYVIGSDGTKISIQPIAQFICDFWYTTNLDIHNSTIKTIRTGSQTENHSLSLCGLNLFATNKPCTFAEYEIEVSEFYLSNSILPIKIARQYFFETKKIVEQTNFEKNKDIYIDQIRKMSLLNVQEYDIIKDETYSVLKLEDKHTIVYTLTVSKKMF